MYNITVPRFHAGVLKKRLPNRLYEGQSSLAHIREMRRRQVLCRQCGRNKGCSELPARDNLLASISRWTDTTILQAHSYDKEDLMCKAEKINERYESRRLEQSY